MSVMVAYTSRSLVLYGSKSGMSISRSLSGVGFIDRLRLHTDLNKKTSG